MITIGIPAHNEQTYIGSVVLLASRVGDKVVVVNDGSTDYTGEILEKAPSNVFVRTHPKNMGYGCALKTIFEEFMAHITQDDDVLVILDGDGQHDPLDVVRVASGVLSGEADIVIGSRFLPDSSTDVTQSRKFGIKSINRLVRGTMGYELTDSQSGFRAYNVRAAETILYNLKNTGMGASLEILDIARKYKFRISEYPISCQYDGLQGSGQSMFTHGADLIGTVVQTIAERYSKWLFVASLVVVVVGSLLGIRGLQLYNELGVIIPNYVIVSFSMVILGATAMQIAITLYSLARMKEG